MFSWAKTTACLLVILMISISLSGCIGSNETQLEAEIADNNQIISDNNLVITELEAEVENLSNLLTVANSNIDNLEQEHSSLTADLILMNNRQNVSEASIKALEQQIFQLEYALVENKSIKNSLQSQLDVVTNSLVEANQQIANLTTELMLANATISTLQEQIAELNAQLNETTNDGENTQDDPYNVLYIGHSFGRPFASQMEDFAALVGIDHNQSIVFSGGDSGSPEELWENVGRRTEIMEILDGGSIDTLVMICCSPSWQADYGLNDDDAVWNFTSYALQQNPNTRIGLAMPWEDFPLQFDNASEHRDLTDRGYNMWMNMAGRLSSDFNNADVFTFYHGEAMYELRHMYEEGNLSDVSQLMGSSENSLFTDQKGHAGQIVIDTGTLLWMAAIHNIEPNSFPEFDDWETDIRIVAQNILSEGN
ncbi:MAG TPA: hypothetical protein HA354_03345 [Candidatus Poseidoniaceae archaeon]|nr:MAG TPA: hypothetical protein D7I07_03320 [Candidatus Poseidoniales archaeon]HII37516.1 hypothetical protein [Candidatus Poseidoniaceae archaeon]